MKDILRSAYTHWHSSIFAGIVGALPSLVIPMMGGTWPTGEDYPKAVAGFLIAAFVLNMKRPSDKAA